MLQHDGECRGDNRTPAQLGLGMCCPFSTKAVLGQVPGQGHVWNQFFLFRQRTKKWFQSGILKQQNAKHGCKEAAEVHQGEKPCFLHASFLPCPPQQRRKTGWRELRIRIHSREKKIHSIFFLN